MSVTILKGKIGVQMQDFIVEEGSVAVDLVSSSQVPIPFLSVVKDGVGKEKGAANLKTCIEVVEFARYPWVQF